MNLWLEGCGLQAEEEPAAARKALRRIMINIYDIVEHNYLVHDDLKALRKYSWRQGKIFPLDEAKAGGELRNFLRPLFKGRGSRQE